MQLPLSLINSLTDIEGFNEDAFVDVHQSGRQITSLRRNPHKIRKDSLDSHFKDVLDQPVTWSQYGHYLSQRPSFTFDPLFHAGCYYVQEASSMFLEQALKQTVDLSKPLKVLDLCAAPGGKSTHLQSLISNDSLLVSNEVIRQRVNILKDNIIKWGSSNVVVTSNDAKDFSKLKGYFDVIVVDAPCSGSGLFRKDGNAINEWSENNVMLCNQRQQRILADVMPALKEDGVLIYSTCSYSKDENEDITNWLANEFQIANLKLEIKPDWNITEVKTFSNHYGYRFWPHLTKGEGFF
ncbi:RsmB/NOP family class I SAM-dependent RNA methyltransferase [Niabella ginsengisoli]|uniref:RsmB/NOP family class I SAM-dependent RNA methyltransferase n=1 Tax=Niabella ginsengisoli TaxID=522298 RepID=A0ABS9SFZ0_9BACT|nr:RsmB/NOP family class I SAM-dependent RNA methyltransferase [Niabella ginsengisoli]MCH5597279.1 RsmB/NOP family class I SAM-dependent RNA methyltransferase [Niabella ginsengisoli]